MGAVLSPKAWEDNSQAKLDYLERLVGKAVQEKMEVKDSLIESLTSERDNLLGKVSQFEALEKAIRAETDAKIKAVKAEAAARIEAANKSHADGSSRQRGVWESQVSELRFQNNKLAAEKLAASKEVDTLRSEVSRLESKVKNKEIKIDLLEEMNSKLDQILDIVKGLAESGASTQQIIEKIDEVKNNTGRIDKIKALIYWEEQGLSSAKDLLPHLEAVGIRHASRISELRKSKEYKDIKKIGGDSNVEA